MSKSLVVLAILGTMSVSAAAQTAPNAPVSGEAQAQPQMVKKTICEESDNPYSRIGRVCHTVMVPVKRTGAAANQQPQPAAQPDSGD